MIDYKTPAEIASMKRGGQILSQVLLEVLAEVKPGVTELAIDQLAEKKIRSLGGVPGFQKVSGYIHTICASTNDVVVHGIPGNYAYQEDDVVGVDCGVYLDNFHTDMSETVRIKNGIPRFYTGQLPTDGDEIDTFLNIGKYALNEAIKKAVIGNHIGHISETIQKIVERDYHYSIVRSLVGHGVGRELHEDPEVPGYLNRPIAKTALLKEGMTIAIEIIYNMGSRVVTIDRDNWTIRTGDHALSGLYERTIAITKNGPEDLTSR